MRVRPLYRYRREDGKIADSPIKPECEYTTRVRMIASEGKTLTNDNKTFYLVKDADSTEGWYEVDKEAANAVQTAE